MMRHVAFTMLILVTFTVFAVAQTPDARWYTSKPEADTFYIRTADELTGLARIVNDVDNGYDFSGKTIVLMDDINLSVYGRSYNGGKGWIPIGGQIDGPNQNEIVAFFPFRGNFDGNGKTVSGLYINDPERKYVGLFGVIGGIDLDKWSDIRNLGVTDAEISGFKSVGALSGEMFLCFVTSCYSTGAINGTDGVGGIVGAARYSSIDDTHSSATVSGNYNIGGLVGGNNGNYLYIENCYSTGNVNGDNNVGGIVGRVEGPSGMVSKCYSTGTVTGVENVGGVGGNIYALFDSYSTGTVRGTKNVGGVVGTTIRGVSNSYSIRVCSHKKGVIMY